MGAVAVKGLPFNPISVTFIGGVRPTSMANLPSSYVWCAYVGVNSDIIIQYISGVNSTQINLTTANYTDSTVIYLAGSYITAS